MQAIQIQRFPKINSFNSLECSCEKINLKSSRKKITICEICSEKKFLRENSQKFCSSCDSFSDSLSGSLSDSLSNSN